MGATCAVIDYTAASCQPVQVYNDRTQANWRLWRSGWNTIVSIRAFLMSRTLQLCPYDRWGLFVLRTGKAVVLTRRSVPSLQIGVPAQLDTKCQSADWSTDVAGQLAVTLSVTYIDNPWDQQILFLVVFCLCQSNTAAGSNTAGSNTAQGNLPTCTSNTVF